MRTSILLVFLFASLAFGQENNLIPPSRQQTHGRARSVPDVASLPSINVDDKPLESDQLTDGEKLFVTHNGLWWYNASDVTAPNINRVDGGFFPGNFVREMPGKFHRLTTAERTNAEIYSFPADPDISALVYDETEGKYYRAEGNGFLVSPTFTEIPVGAGGGMTSWDLAGDTGTPETVIDADTVTVAGGEGIATVVTATDTLTVNLSVDTLPGNVSITGNETILIYNPTTLQHETVLITDLPGNMTFSLAGDTGTPEVIADANTMTVAGGEGIDTIVSATDTLTVDMAIDTLPATPGLTGNETVAIYNPTTLAHESILITSLPGGADTNFANTDLTFVASRSHELSTNAVDVTNGATIYWSLDGGNDVSFIGSSGSNFLADVDGLQLNIGTGNDLKIDSDPGEEGEVPISHGPLTPPTWGPLPLAIEDDAAPIEAAAKKINFGAGISAVNSGANTVLVEATGGGGSIATEDEGVSIEADTQTIDFVGQGITATSTGGNAIEVNTDHKIEYGENLTAGDFVKIGPDGKAYALFATPIQQVDTITTTDWESIVSGTVNGDFQFIGRIDDDRVVIGYRDETPTNMTVIADRSGTNTYSTFGTPISLIVTGVGYQASTGHLISAQFDNSLSVHSVSGTALASVGSTTFTNRGGGNERGIRFELFNGETDQWFCVHQRDDGHMWGATVDVSTPSSPSISDEVDFGDAGATFDYYLGMQRISGNRFLIQWTGTSNEAKMAVVTADPGGSHTMGPIYSQPSSGSSNERDGIVMLSDSRGVLHFRTGVAGADDKLQLIEISGNSISAIGSVYDLAITDNNIRPYMQRLSDDQFVLATGSAGVVRATIFNIVADSFVQIDTTSVTSTETDTARKGPSGAWQGGNSFAYLTGDGAGLHFVESTIASLIADLEKVAGTAGETLTAGSTGIIRYHGEISENQSGLSVGEVHYMTTGGVITTLDTGYKLGVALTATDLLLDFDIVTNAASGDGYASILVEGNSTATTPPGTSSDFSQKVQVLIFDTDGADESRANADHTNDHIVLLESGNWEISIDASFVGTANDVVSFGIFKNNGTAQIGTRATQTAQTTPNNVSLTRQVYGANAGDTIELWLQDETGTNNVTVQDGAISVKKL